MNELKAIAADAGHQCQHCGRVYDEPITTAPGCFSDDCVGYDLERIQEKAELDLLYKDRAVRRMRPHW